MFYRLLAELVVGFHVLYVSFVVLGQFAIWVGLARGWAWVRNFWFRWAHLLIMTIVGVEAVVNVLCPLTYLEAHLRTLAGQAPHSGSFLGAFYKSVFFSAYFPGWFIRAMHVTFTLVVVGTFVLAPPRRRPRAASSEQPGTAVVGPATAPIPGPSPSSS